MIEEIIQYDKEIFNLINQGLSNQVFDSLMPFIRNKYTWSPLYIAIVLIAIFRFKTEGVKFILFLVLTVLASDQISASIIKPLFERLRPCRTEDLVDNINLLVTCGGGFSFISAHACNHFAIAALIGRTFRKRFQFIIPIGFLWAAMISFAQVYVGVHFPTDILAGGILGIIIGLGMSELFKKGFRKNI